MKFRTGNLLLVRTSYMGWHFGLPVLLIVVKQDAKVLEPLSDVVESHLFAFFVVYPTYSLWL